MHRFLIFAYGLICYLMFLGVFLYAAGFVGNLLVPKSIDSGAAASLPVSIAINLGLLGLFAIQHSVMARPTFKRWWTRIVPEPAERSTYVLLSNLCMIALFVGWQPITATIWDVQHPAARALIWTVFAAGWLIVLTATFMINHFDLFGLRQVWLHLLGRPYTQLRFGTPGYYRHVRHPLYVGWILAFWAIPTMTMGHLLFALVTTGYILIAIFFEERNLIEAYGETYATYRRRTPMLIPGLKRANASDTGALTQPNLAEPEVASST